MKLGNHLSYIRARIVKAGKTSAITVTPALMKDTKERGAVWDLGSLFSWVVNPKSHNKSTIDNDDLILVDESLVYRPKGKYPSSLHPFPLVFGSAEEKEEYRNIVVYCSRKIRESKKRGIQFLFTPQDILILLNEAGIRFSDIGLVEGYHLSRKNDEGNYQWGNAKFVPAEENRRVASRVQGMSCRVGSNYFDSIPECALAMGVSYMCAYKRFKSSKYPDWEALPAS